MADIIINYSIVQQSAAKLKQGKEHLEQEVRQVGAQIGQLTGGQGYNTRVASRIFGQSFTDWREGYLHMLDGLIGMSDYLDQVIREHEQLDQNLAGGAGSGH